ncbi:hypothetical protein ACJMK2_040835 [Sinanodonta woodiana]|uniref:PLAT domain-containing protein n=1 Tax=Sinanodonta woodiana TaxID=1069815 RepID=A0ABD3W288_SINWO
MNSISMRPNVITVCLASACLLSGHVVGNERNTVENDRNTICYGDVGCFVKNNRIFTLDLFPESPEKIKTEFRLFTQKNGEDNMFQILNINDVTSITDSNFDHCRPTKIVVHGFRSSAQIPWMTTMKTELLKAGDFNVILVDWENGANYSYNQATVNTRVVGAVIAQMINLLKDQVEADPKDFHIIGHSIGAHICGYAGERIPNLGRITGLEPSALNYQYKDHVVRLDPTDAQFVDVIHTDGRSLLLFGLGMFEAVGHVDYYPNGGLVQPGCETYSIFSNNPACRHLRSHQYFIDSINSECQFIGYRCQSYRDFKNGDCIPCSDGGCGYMGFHADKAKPPEGSIQVTYFLETGASKPFCRYHYQVKVVCGNTPDWKKEKRASVINLIGTKGQSGEKPLTSSDMNIEPGKSYVFILTSINDLGTVHSAEVTWQQEKTTPLQIHIEKLEIGSGQLNEK